MTTFSTVYKRRENIKRSSDTERKDKSTIEGKTSLLITPWQLSSVLIWGVKKNMPKKVTDLLALCDVSYKRFLAIRTMSILLS